MTDPARIVVIDDEARMCESLERLLGGEGYAVEAFVDDHRVLVEPSCGAALSLLYGAHEALQGPVLAIVCGGAAATRESLAEWRAGVRD